MQEILKVFLINDKTTLKKENLIKKIKNKKKE